jgi:acyl-CoA synthetase (AMP-forming)/AMP-acid ligase II
MNGPVAPQRPRGLAESVASHVAARGDAPAFRFLDRNGAVKREISWRGLHRDGCRIAARLATDRLAGQRVAIVCPEPADFVVALVGCLIAGSVAVPVPAVATRRSAERIGAIIRTAMPAAVIGSAGTLAEPWIAASLGGASVLPLDALSAGETPQTAAPVPDPADPALVQFTSGSTATPRGVLLSHANLAANCAAIAEAYDLDAGSVGFSWLPLHHDMGLVGHVLATLFVGGCSVIMNPLHFLQSPLRWLRQAGEQRATITSAPNFAYALCVQAAEEADIDGLDLSSLTAAVCGGEPVSAETMTRFCETFARFGFRRSAFAPSYGLAEATLLVSSGRRRSGPVVHLRNAAGAQPVVSVGRAVRGCAVRIVDGRGEDCADGEVGEIEVSGASVGVAAGEPGGKPGVVRTGDLGYLVNGELHVSGRSKELIILRGQNVFPADIEAAALAAGAGLRPGGVAAIGVSERGTEALVVLVEVDGKRVRGGDLMSLERAVSRAVTEASGFTPSAVLPVGLGALPRTTSGKLQRTLIARMLADGTLRPLIVAADQEA